MSEELLFTPRLKKALAIAVKTARQKGHTYVGVEHAFIGLMKEPSDALDKILGRCVVYPKDFRTTAEIVFDREYPSEKKPSQPSFEELATAMRKLADWLNPPK